MARRKITHRKPNFQFDSDIPKHWLGGSPFKTHFLNSLTLIFPMGEKYFIRSINHVLKDIKSEILKEDAKNFIKQEAQHSREHEKFFKVLDIQGYSHKNIVDKLDHLISNILEPFFNTETNLAITAGLEHLTAMLSEISLEEDFLKDAPKQLQDLFNWHAAEEIEHRSVAFDILQEVTKSYSKRVQGIIIGYIVISIFASFCTLFFLYKDKKLLDPETMNDFSKIFFTEEKLFFKALRIFIRYLHPNFHPDQQQLDSLAKPIFNTLFSSSQPSMA